MRTDERWIQGEGTIGTRGNTPGARETRERREERKAREGGKKESGGVSWMRSTRVCVVGRRRSARSTGRRVFVCISRFREVARGGGAASPPFPHAMREVVAPPRHALTRDGAPRRVEWDWTHLNASCNALPARAADTQERRIDGSLGGENGVALMGRACRPPWTLSVARARGRYE